MGKKRSLETAGGEPPKKKIKISSSDTIEEVAFPRGGKSVLSSLEVRKIHEEVKQDLFKGTSSPQKKPISKKKSTSTTKKKPTKVKKLEEDDDLDDSVEGMIRRLDRDTPTVADSISFHVCLLDQVEFFWGSDLE